MFYYILFIIYACSIRLPRMRFVFILATASEEDVGDFFQSSIFFIILSVLSL